MKYYEDDEELKVFFTHPRKAHVRPSAIVGSEIVVEPLAGLNTGVVIGSGCSISKSSDVDHDRKIGVSAVDAYTKLSNPQESSGDHRFCHSYVDK
jgi:acyl-[acyl carrier protein]--UDP-N-acetylglucosamine O-acyltransferase